MPATVLESASQPRPRAGDRVNYPFNQWWIAATGAEVGRERGAR